MDETSSSARLSAWTPYALAALRIIAGLLFMCHGLVKMFGFPAGAQPGQQALMSLLGAAGAIEVAAGLLIAIGLFTRAAAFIASGEMAVGYWMFHAPQSPFPVANMGDAASVYCFLFLYLAAAGPGAFSVDAALAKGRRGTDDSSG
jgi:putative oxidoreductase